MNVPAAFDCDVFVAGGGPAGSTIAALLAERGHSVRLADKDTHPRFHIGESLLPLNMPYFKALGIEDEVAAVGMPKYGVEFVSPYHNKAVCLDFSQAWNKNYPYSYQVRRSTFDHILLKNAAAKGAEISEGCRVTAVSFEDQGGATVTARMADGVEKTLRARFFVDATGRETLLANRMELKQRNRRHGSAAVYGHFTNARRLEGKKQGNITIFWFDRGWFWFIPLSDGTTSVGAVCKPDYLKSREGDVTALFHSLIAMCPEIAGRLKDAEMTGPATATGNYSYRSERMTGRDHIMIGDAFAFIDPVFSTGVYLAMRSAFLGAEAVSISLSSPAQSAKALKHFEREVKNGIDTFSWYIYRITRPAIRNLFMNPRNYFRVQEAVLGLLAGDIERGSPVHLRLKLFKAIYYINHASIAVKQVVMSKHTAPVAANIPAIQVDESMSRKAA